MLTRSDKCNWRIAGNDYLILLSYVDSTSVCTNQAQIEESKKTWKFNQLKALHEADEERADLEEDDILYCAGSYDPEAARLAELDELERAELAETLHLSDPSPRHVGRGRPAASGTTRVGRGGGRGRGRGRGRGISTAVSTPRNRDVSMHRDDSDRSLSRVSFYRFNLRFL